MTFLGFIGAGRMAQAMCRGAIGSGMMKSNQIVASDPDGRILAEWEKLKIKTTHDNAELASKSKVVVIGVKPNMVRRVLREIAGTVTPDHLIVSIAGGITIKSVQKELPDYSRVVRVMPNTPALVQMGTSVFSRGHHTHPDDAELVHKLFSTFGICEEMEEKYLDAVTGLSGSGPGYMFMALEAMADGGVKMGLPRVIATRLAAQTMMGSAKMVIETGEHPGSLKDSVCSPSGTTIQGVYELERNGFRYAIVSAVEAAAKRSYEFDVIENYDTASEATGLAREIEQRKRYQEMSAQGTEEEEVIKRKSLAKSPLRYFQSSSQKPEKEN